MKKFTTLLILSTLIMASANAQGRFEVIALDNAKLHVYYSNDVMADASYVVEGNDGLVTIETPLFKSALKEFNDYVATLNKPVVTEITNYHVGGTGSHRVVMASGMGEFVKVGPYAAMMAGFQQSFGESMVDLPTGEVSEVPFGESRTYAGVEFKFNHGSSTDFPAASILIDGTAVLMHWAPVKAHLNALQIGSRAAVDAEIKALDDAKATGAKYFCGGHLGVSNIEGLEFKVAYLTKIKELLSQCVDADSFATSLKNAFPGLYGEDSVAGLAAALYPAAK